MIPPVEVACDVAPAVLLWIGLVPLAREVVIRWTILGELNGLSPIRWYIYAPVYNYFAVLALLAIRRRQSYFSSRQ